MLREYPRFGKIQKFLLALQGSMVVKKRQVGKKRAVAHCYGIANGEARDLAVRQFLVDVGVIIADLGLASESSLRSIVASVEDACTARGVSFTDQSQLFRFSWERAEKINEAIERRKMPRLVRCRGLHGLMTLRPRDSRLAPDFSFLEN